MRPFLGTSLVLAAGLAAAALTFPRVVRLDGDADWRAASQGLRRSTQPGILVAARDALVHFHDVRGGLSEVALRISARSEGRLIVQPERRSPVEVALAREPQTIVIPAGGAASFDLRLEMGRDAPDRVFLHEIRLRRGEAGGALRLAPLLVGLVVLLLLRRDGESVALATAVAVATVAVSAAALLAAADPTALLPFRPGTRSAAQTLALAALAAFGVARRPRAALSSVLVVAAAVVLYAPTVRYGLVYDDFLWTRPWTLREVASTFVGSEDPTGVSNSYYRPWASTSHAIDFLVWGFRPALFHATNLLLIAAAGLAALSLLRRLEVDPAAALAGALAWIAHPMSASAVAWLSQRTDILLALLYLLTLRALVARRFGRGQVAAVIALGALTLGAKELAVTLPAAGALLLLCRAPDEAAPRRWAAVRGLALLVLAYVPLWIAMFPEKFVTRTGASAGWGGFDPGQATDWLRLLPALYGPLLLPTGYASWWRTLLQDWSPLYLAGVAVLTALLATRIGRDPDPLRRRLGGLALVWPILVIAPLLGLRGVDLYRGGLLVALSAGWLVAVLVWRARDVDPRLAVVLMAGLGLVATPLTRDSAAAWGPGGFYRTMTQASNREMTGWLDSLQPHCRAHFWWQVARDEHMAGGE